MSQSHPGQLSEATSAPSVRLFLFVFMEIYVFNRRQKIERSPYVTGHNDADVNHRRLGRHPRPPNDAAAGGEARHVSGFDPRGAIAA
ncbi:hypothetical protein EVAR_33105_1 [Eumeta japonica]|uniref:Uncharacterized protein n=1 Tax=Eumeta variegata TaxID=151549 RepID=A0A4C1YBS5_EUMVA|nr:hypothetical protein EVAR_33105_1 [Eumeta japonica]